MISSAELHRLASAWNLRFDQVEKDYVIVWLLFALSQRSVAPKGWVFKGGTCLRHCYYRGYRFSEDIDFSCDGAKSNLDDARERLERAAVWIERRSGIQARIKTPQTVPGDFQVEIPVEYSRGGGRVRGLPCVKVHLTFDEPILTGPAKKPVHPLFPDPDFKSFTLNTYSKPEIIAEKMRALIQQQKKWPRPRDLYDLWYMLCIKRERVDREKITDLFRKKCEARGVAPELSALMSKNLAAMNEQAWQPRLSPMMAQLPSFHQVWNDWTSFVSTYSTHSALKTRGTHS